MLIAALYVSAGVVLMWWLASFHKPHHPRVRLWEWAVGVAIWPIVALAFLYRMMFIALDAILNHDA